MITIPSPELSQRLVKMASGFYPEVDLNPLQRAFNLFLMALPSSDLDNLVSFIRHSDEAERLNYRDVFMRQTTDVINAIAAEDPIPSSPESSTESIEIKKKLRPLNSFMAYRSKNEKTFQVNKKRTIC